MGGWDEMPVLACGHGAGQGIATYTIFLAVYLEKLCVGALNESLLPTLDALYNLERFCLMHPAPGPSASIF